MCETSTLFQNKELHEIFNKMLACNDVLSISPSALKHALQNRFN